MYIPLALGLLKAQAIKEQLCPQYYDIEILDVDKSLNYGEARLVKYLTDNKPDISYYGAGRKKVKYFSLDRAKKELEIIKMQNGPRDCEFIDSTSNILGRLEEIFEMIKEVNSDKYFRFRIEANPEFINEKQIEMFKEMNVIEVEIGIQSTDKDELKAINRVFHEDKVTANIKLLEKSGLPVFYHLIIGLPNQTKESFKRSCDYLRELGVGNKVQAFLLQVLPGTELRKKSEELGVYFRERAPYFVEETSKLSNEDIQELIEELKSKTLSRFIVNEDLLNNVCRVLSKIFQKSPYVCTDLVFDGDYIISNEEVFEIYKTLATIFKSFEKYNLQAVMFVSGEIINWDIIVSKLKDVYEFSKRNYYVFFDNIVLQQFYDKELKLITADKYPFD